MFELIDEAARTYPHDRFFDEIRQTLREEPSAHAAYMMYERALQALDGSSWSILKEKAIRHFLDHRPGQLKQGFFNQLHDAFAYERLVCSGATSVRILEERNTKTPDIRYNLHRRLQHCEVKTLGISDDEIHRREQEDANSSSIYARLSPEFLRKLGAALDKASEQIASQGTEGLVFVLIQFDDIAGDYHFRYREQLKTALFGHSVKTACLASLQPRRWTVQKNCAWLSPT